MVESTSEKIFATAQSNTANSGVARLFVQGVTKTFPGVTALSNVSLEVLPGEVHALVGENGAGKSTLMHLIAGVHRFDKGQMFLDGAPYAPHDEKAAQQAGVAIVYQEGSLFPPLSIAENIFAGRQPTTIAGLIDFPKMVAHTHELLHDLEVKLHAFVPVEQLSPGQRQLVEIAKALSQQVQLLILDEPTSSLTIAEARHLYKIIRRLAERGVAIIYVSHRMSEIFEIADRATVLKDGKVTGVRAIRETTPDEIIHLEVGRDLSFAPDPARVPTGAASVLEVSQLKSSGVHSASLTVRQGEIVCLAGLVGAGRTELCEAIFGIRPHESGTLRLNGQRFQPRHPLDSMNAGIGMVPEDRRDAGLFLDMSIAANIGAANLNAVSQNGLIQEKRLRQLAQRFVQSLRVATPDIHRPVMFLSGGNQQKVLLGKWLARQPKLLIVDEPTRGVDVGAKADIYAILRDLAHSGIALLVVSSDLPEVLALAHRIVVMAEGHTVGELDPQRSDEISILQLATPKSVLQAG